MDILLDTHILLWAITEPERLPTEVQARLMDPHRTVFFSTASIWEIGIKASLGKTDFPFQPHPVYALAIETGFTELAVTSVHACAVARLPWLHRDPFDRLLVAQAKILGLRLLTVDTVLVAYSDLVELIN